MSKHKWHDVTSETGDPNDLPPYLVAADGTPELEYDVTLAPVDGDVCVARFSGSQIHECVYGSTKDNPRVIAWRKQDLEPYTPGSSRCKWHDLIANPNDLPTRSNIYLVMIDRDIHITDFIVGYDASLSYWRDSVTAWRKMPKGYYPLEGRSI